MEFCSYLGNVSLTKGIVTILSMVLSSYCLPTLKWVYPAATTPLMMLVLNCVFFVWLNCTVANFTTAIIGAIVIVFSKSTKYSLFDPCKEIVYIPLSHQERKLGKSTVDIISNPLGKSGGSLLQQGLILKYGSVLNCVHQIFTILCGSLIVWFFAVLQLNKHLNIKKNTSNNETVQQ